VVEDAHGVVNLKISVVKNNDIGYVRKY